MKVSKQGIEFIQRLSTKNGDPLLSIGKDAYGQPVIGYGHRIHMGERSKWANGLTKAQATKIIKDDLQGIEEALDRESWPFVLQQNEYDALASLAYSLGGVSFIGVKMRHNIKAGDKSILAEGFYTHTKITKGGSYVNSIDLMSRRRAESRLFLLGEYHGQAPEPPKGKI